MSYRPPPGRGGIPTKITRTTTKITPNETVSTSVTTIQPPRPTGIPQGPRSGIARPSAGSNLVALPASASGISKGAIPKYGGIGRPSNYKKTTETTTVDKTGKRTTTTTTITSNRSSASVASGTGRMMKSTVSKDIGGKKTVVSKTKLAPPPPQALAAGQYYVPMQTMPRTAKGKTTQYSSPMYLRPRLDAGKGPVVNIPANYKTTQDYKKLLRVPAGRDIEAGNLFVGGAYVGSGGGYQNASFLDEPISASMIGDDWDSIGNAEDLETEVQNSLLESYAQTPNKALKAMGSRSKPASPKVIMTDQGPIEADEEVITSQTVVRSPEMPEIIGRHMEIIKRMSPGQAVSTELELQQLSPKTKGKTQVDGRDVVHVITSVATTPDFKQTTKTVTYETQPSPPRPPIMPNTLEISKLIDAENEDIAKTRGLIVPDLEASRVTTYPTRKHVNDLRLSPDAVSILEHVIMPKPPTADEEQEEPQPEMLANMLNTEERGLSMDSAPTNVYNYLFEQEKTEAVVDVCSAITAPMQDIVVPLAIPEQVEDINKNPEVQQVAVLAEQHASVPISDNAYTESQGKEPLSKPVNAARKGPGKRKRKVPVLAKETPPWGLQDLESLIDLVGGPPAGTLLALDVTDSIELDPAVDGIEYMLHLEAPTHTSRVQLRGSQNPNWFPGYIMAFPDIPEVVALAKSPSAVFTAAWKATTPDIFNDNSLFIV